MSDSEKAINEVYSQLISVVRDTYEKASSSALVKTNYGIIVFGEFAIMKTKNGFKVVARRTHTEAEFGSIRNALAWIIFEHQGRFKDSERIAKLDAQISSLDIELSLHKRVKDRVDSSRYLIMLNKIQTETHRKQNLTSELNKYLTAVKQLAPTVLELS